jgi:hypothetical protein
MKPWEWPGARDDPGMTRFPIRIPHRGGRDGNLPETVFQGTTTEGRKKGVADRRFTSLHAIAADRPTKSLGGQICARWASGRGFGWIGCDNAYCHKLSS